MELEQVIYIIGCSFILQIRICLKKGKKVNDLFKFNLIKNEEYMRIRVSL